MDAHDDRGRDLLTPDLMWRIDRYLRGRLIGTFAVVSATFSIATGILVWALTKSSEASAKEAIAEAQKEVVQAMLSSVKEISPKIGKVESEAGQMDSRIAELKTDMDSIGEEVSNFRASVDRRVNEIETELEVARSKVRGFEGELAQSLVENLLKRPDFSTEIRDAWSRLPVGSIIPYSGVIRSGSDVPQGWLLCDGDVYKSTDYPELSSLLAGRGASQFEVPDLRAMFLRGLDNSDVSTEGSEPSPRDPDHNRRKLLSVQPGSTARPVSGWRVQASGEHHHEIKLFKQGNTQTIENPNDGLAALIAAKDTNGSYHAFDSQKSVPHSHQVAGGDEETRPTNVAVNWLVKY